MEWAKLFVELAKALAWPSTVLMLGLYFRDDFRAMLPRLTKAGPTGFEFNSQIRNLQNWSGKLKDIPGFARTKKIEEIEISIHQELPIIDADSRIDFLVGQLAQTRLARIFERTYSNIFGSQIALLRALATRSTPSSLSEAIDWFNEVKSKNSSAYADATFDRWFSYLAEFDLARIDQQSVSITEMGKDFLLYLGAAKLSDAKPL